ncbi:MAG: GNAT family N-acetyltransferase [Nitrospinae bacterium]|nr:GNAT family N-acetyltransferase [Nitrospinota bacterium]
MNITLEKLAFREEPTQADAEAVRLIVQSSGFFNEEEVDIAVELVDERLAKGTASGYYFIFAESGGQVIGYACYGPIGGTKDSFDIYWVAVREDMKAQGLGTSLLTMCEKAVARAGGGRIYVDTSSRPQYEPTRHFYEKRGYHREAILPDFYAQDDGKLIYLKKLR